MSKKETATGKFYLGGDPSFEVPQNPFTADLNKQKLEKEAREVIEFQKQLDMQKQREIESRLQTLELCTIANKLIILPYPENPYRNRFTESGIILDSGGSFLNPDSGEMDKKAEFVRCAKVVDAGPECKYVKEGDDVFYLPGAVFPIPYMSLGYVMASESNLIAIINEGLKERFNEVKK